MVVLVQLVNVLTQDIHGSLVGALLKFHLKVGQELVALVGDGAVPHPVGKGLHRLQQGFLPDGFQKKVIHFQFDGTVGYIKIIVGGGDNDHGIRQFLSSIFYHFNAVNARYIYVN